MARQIRVIFIHVKAVIAVAITALTWMKITDSILKIYHRPDVPYDVQF